MSKWIQTTLENHLEENVEVREGHQGVFSTVKTLGKMERYILRHDLTCTYRKFMLVGPGRLIKIIGSDDIIEHSIIKVVPSLDAQGNVLGWDLEMVKRSQQQPLGKNDQGSGSWKGSMLEKLGIAKKH